MKFLVSGIFCLFVFCVSAQTLTYSRVKIYTDDAGINQLAHAGITIDHGEYRAGCCFTTDLSSEEIERVHKLGFNYVIEIPDVQSYYANRNSSGETSRSGEEQTQTAGCNATSNILTPANFTLGSMGGFFTLPEIYWHLDNMAALYPNLVKPRCAIDSNNLTSEGRMVYWTKISDNAAVDENEPEMLYSAAHHAREPAGVSQLIMYMYYLLENYSTNPEIQYIVNNTELYFVPMVNPDGYNYNATISANGGGMWRKNRTSWQDGYYGADLNRNYSFNWGYDDFGSSPNDYDDTYRGPSPSSEAEVQNMETLCANHTFKIAINYHTYGNLLICPWGYEASTYTPDMTTYNAWGDILTKDNQYSFGTADQTVHYVTNGSSDDWMYGEQAIKPKIMAMTPEAGDQSDGFWPSAIRIEDICRGNIPMDLYAAKLLLAYAVVENNDGKYITPNGKFHFNIQRLGLDSPAVYTVNIVAISPQITSVGAAVSFPSLAIAASVNDSIGYTINPATPEGTMLTYVVETSNGSFTWRDTITRMYGNPITLYSTNGSSMNGWTQTDGWDITNEDYISPSECITDSPFTTYQPNNNQMTIMTQNVSLSTAFSAHLTFYTKFEIEAGYDDAVVECSADNGVTWTSLCGKYTTINNGLNFGNPCYTGVRHTWVREDMSLDDYVGMDILIRYRMESDQWGEYDGIYLDDIILEVLDTSGSGIHENVSNALIGQNIPNPSIEETFIPLKNTSAGVIEIYSQVGQLVKTQDVNANANGVFVSTADLAAGVYSYRFVSDGVATETRRMIVAK
jgi:carboxypeptidase T